MLLIYLKSSYTTCAHVLVFWDNYTKDYEVDKNVKWRKTNRVICDLKVQDKIIKREVLPDNN